MYKSIDTKDIDYLRGIIPSERVFCKDEISEDYSHDELGGVERYPDLLIEVLSAEEVSKIMTYANSQNIPVVARGSGTGLVGGSVAVFGGIMISLQKMNKILELDAQNLTLTVEPGVLLMDIYKFVEEEGLFYPPDPGEKSATIGGNISTNAGGMRAVKYGVTRDYVRGLEAVLPNGDIIEVGGKVVKNSSGYSIKDLLIGSEGTLAIITKAILKLIPLPNKVISLLVPFKNIDRAISTVPLIIKSKVTPTAVEFMEREIILDSQKFLGKTFPDESADAYLLLSYDGLTKENIEQDYDAVCKLCLEQGALDVFIIDTDERKESVWAARGAFLEAVKASTTFMDECDVVVPRDKVAEFVNYIYEVKKEHNVRIKSFGHAGDGNLHIYVLRDDLDEISWKQKINDVFRDFYSKARELQGKVSGEHGIGIAKLPYLLADESIAVQTLMKGIKAVFDPKNILNPSKVVI